MYYYLNLLTYYIYVSWSLLSALLADLQSKKLNTKCHVLTTIFAILDFFAHESQDERTPPFNFFLIVFKCTAFDMCAQLITDPVRDFDIVNQLNQVN